jgi:hypothetical protein
MLQRSEPSVGSEACAPATLFTTTRVGKTLRMVANNASGTDLFSLLCLVTDAINSSHFGYPSDFVHPYI